MTRREVHRLDRELQAYLDELFGGLGRRERRQALTWYVTGLLLDGERKSVQPMAARLVDAAAKAEAMRQRLQQAVTVSPWSDDVVRGRLARTLDRALPGIDAQILDDTGLPKKGTHSVGVARQYSGTLGRTENCQVAVSLHLAGEAGSGCIALQLYLPESWATDRARRRPAGVPDDVAFQSKWQIALGQLDDARRWGVRRHVVLADAAYGDVPEFRGGVAQRGLRYVVGVQSTHRVWPSGSHPHPPTRRRGQRGRPPTRWRDGRRRPVAIAALARQLGRAAYRPVTWREGSRGPQTSRFAARRVRPAEGHSRGRPPATEQWLLIEWPEGEETPTKFWLSTLPATTSRRRLVRLAHLRWRVERDYEDLKGELGLDHFEGRTWRGLHHHATLCLLAHGFLARRRALSPPALGAVDAPAGPPTPPGRAPALDRRLPALSAARRRRHVAARPVTHVTK